MLRKKYLILVSIVFLNLFSTKEILAQTLSNPVDNFSNKPVISVGGFINMTSAFRDRASAFGNNRLPDAQVSGGAVDGTTGSQNHYSHNADFANDSEIHIKVGGINEFGMKYGGVIELEADVSSDGRDEGFNADKSYIFTESRLGRFEFGNNIGSNQKMKVGPATFARAAGGVNGKYLEYINPSVLADSSQGNAIKIGDCDGLRVSGTSVAVTGADCNKVKLPNFILLPQSPVSHGGYAQGFYNRATDNSYTESSEIAFNRNSDGSFGQLEDATKVSYFTPRISNFQLGLSYTPDTGNSGTSADITGDQSGDIKNLISFGANYSNNVGNLGLAFSLTGEVGKYEQASTAAIKRNNLNAFDVGFMATYFGFTLGGSYGNWSNSLAPKTGIYSCQYDKDTNLSTQDCSAGSSNEFDDANYYTSGLAYQFGPLAFSATYLKSEFQANKYNATSVGLDYRMAKGLMPYLEVTEFEFEANQPNTLDVNHSSLGASKRQIKDNEGYLILVGILFSF